MKKRGRHIQKIASIEELKREACEDADFALLLKHGLFSRKSIRYDGDSGVFSIWNHIDDTGEELTEQELKKTLIAEAMKKGAFVKLEDYEGGLRGKGKAGGGS